MKQLFRFWIVAALLLMVGCSKEYDDSALVGRVDDLESRVQRLEQLCQQMNTNISSLQTIVTALQNNDFVTGVTPITENGKTIGYTITFAKAQSITIYHGKDGQNGADGKDSDFVPTIGVKQDTDGIYYWTLDGAWLLDDSGNKIKAVGTNGKDGITPQLKIENDYWYVSYDNGASWTQLGKATGEDGKDGTNGTDGTNGSDGKSFFQDVTQDDNNVYFTLADGTVITIPKGSALSIEFAESDLVVMSPNSTREIGYTVTSATETVKVEVTSSADIKAKAVTDNASGLTGKIHITTGATIDDEYSKVIVFVSNGDKVIMRSITFEEAGLVVEENATKQATAEGGEMTLEFLSNVECEVVIPEDAQSWMSVVPTSRAMEKQTITLKLEPNEGYYRSATVTVQSLDGKLTLDYQIEQEGDLGVEIDPNAVPDNEIWYITNNGKLYDHLPASISNANIVSHTYDKKGIIQFDAPLNLIKREAFCKYDWSQNYLIKIALPNCVETIEAYAFQYNQISTFHTPNSLKYVGQNFIENLADIDISFTGKYATKDGRCIIIDDILYIGKDIKGEYVIPNGVKTISDCAFANNIKMEQIVFPDGLTDIRYGAFMGCTNLSGDIYIPNSVELIEERVFSGCGHITSFWGNTLFTDESQLFLYAYNVVGQKTITCFASGAAVRSIIIPEGVEMIGYGCFMNCDFIESITFPNSLRLIGEDAFDGCTGLSSFYGYHISDDNKCLILDYPNLGWAQYYSGVLMAFAGHGVNAYKTPNNVRAIAPLVFKNHPSLQKIVINDEVTYIGMYAFNDNPNLQEIVLPSSLLEMSYDPFKGCNGLNAIYCRSMIPPKLDYIYQTDFPNLTIYVPEQSLQAYLDSPDWAPYRGYIQGYEYTDLPENDTYISSDYSKDGEVTTLQTATKGKGIDIVLMGDAYSDRQIADGTYKTDMEYIYNNLFTEEPYKSFKDHFNVYYVNVVSVTEGYEHGGTALGGYFGNGTLVGGNDNAVFDYALNAISEEEMDEALLIVAMNSDNYAGTCYMYYPESVTGIYGSGPSVAYFPRGGDAETFAQLLHHEACGHGFAKLADEYAYEYMGEVPSNYVSEIQTQQNDWGWWKNVDFTSDPTAIRWSHFINDTRYANEGLGAYEGGLTYWTGVWRPTENSIMCYNTGGFNAPSREAIYYRIHKLAYGDSWEYDYEDFVEWDARNRATAATRAMVYKPANYRPTHPPVIVNKSWKDAK